jgi:hypothetical protein
VGLLNEAELMGLFLGSLVIAWPQIEQLAIFAGFLLPQTLQ